MATATPDPGDLSGVFKAIRDGDDRARERLFDAVYEELRGIARNEMARERPGHTLQTTALVNEVWLKLFKDDRQAWDDRRYFFGAAARAMRCILIDHARRKAAQRHGGGLQRVTLDSGLMDTPSPDLLALDEALERLEKKSARTVRVVELRYFAGLTIKDTAEQLQVSERTVSDDWHYAKAWLRRELSPGSASGERGEEPNR